MRRTELVDWEFCEIGTDNWLPALVPGYIHLDLMRHGIIPDPRFSMNERDVQWVDERAWSYRCRFQWEPDPDLPETVIRFEGLDTVCELFLNGEPFCKAADMFCRFEPPLELLQPGENEIRIDFSPAAHIGAEQMARYLEAEGLPPDCAGFFERSFVRKAQYMFGWDWGPRLVSCGIVRPVFLVDRKSLTEQQVNARPVAQRPKIDLKRVHDDFGESFEFLIEGRPLWVKGANWIPDHSFPSEVTPERLKQRLEQAKDLGINMLRVWGGGYYEQDAFYDLCDELGILVWQDFMFSCAYYPDEGAFAEIVRKEAEHQVKRLRHHPCISLWCGNNENQMMFVQKWGDRDKQPPRLYGAKLYDDVLRDVVERLDPERPYIPGSPIGGQDPNSGGIGDQHYWEVWHGKGDWVHYRDSTARFCSEFGFASSPSMAVWNSYLRPEERDLGSEAMLWHDKTGKPWETFQSFVELHYPKSQTLEDWVYYSQLNQRDAMREAIEHFRCSEFCKGALVWQLNDCWPAQSWSLIDFAGFYKAAAFELKRLYSDELLVLHVEGDRCEARLINDGGYTIAPARIIAIDVVYDQRIEECIGALTLGGLDRRRVILWAEHKGACAWRLLCEPKDFESECQTLELWSIEGGVGVYNYKPVIDLWLQDAEGEFSFEPNFVTALSGGIDFQTECPLERIVCRSLAGVHPNLINPEMD